MNDCLRIEISLDGIEGEIYVGVQVMGGPTFALADVVESVDGLRLSRLRRGATLGMIESRLQAVGELLATQARDLLAGEPRALGRFRQRT